jgi:superfamily II DNA/RNA helicase
MVMFGGVGMGAQIKKAPGVDILVATPAACST